MFCEASAESETGADDGETSRSGGASSGAMTEASSRALFDGSTAAAEELRLEDRSKNTGRNVSVSRNTWSWFSFVLFSWEFMEANGQ